MILAIFFVSLLAVSAVSAADNVTNDVVGVEETTDDVVSVEENQVFEQTDNKEVICETDNGTFTALQNKIKNAEQDSTIILENDYSYDEGFDKEGILIDKSLTIDGKNRVIDANSRSRIFLLTSNNVTLKNIVFKGGNHDLVGGAISNSGDYCNIISCSFMNCSIESYSARGGAIYNTGEYCNIVLCNFTNCYIYAGDFEDDEGGAIRNSNPNSIVRLCNFIECKSRFFGGALSGGSAVNCTFIRCYSKVGGAIYYVNAENCTFINNTAEEYGGAGYVDLHTPILDCKFFDNSARWGGAMYYGELVNSVFINNSAQAGGVCGLSFAYNCTFINNSAEHGGVLTTQAHAYNCRFIGNFAQYGGVAEDAYVFDSYIKDCYSYVEGGAFYRCYNPSNNTFENCYSYGYGGACSDTSINNSTFISCHSMMDGGATYNCGKVTNSNFINCYCEHDGGAIYSKKSSIEGCNFTGCFAKFDGGAIYTIELTIINKNNFMGCQASDGGAICLWYHGGNITGCEFKKCKATNDGGAVYALEATTIDKSSFIDCIANNGGAIYFRGDKSVLTNSYFKGNSANTNSHWKNIYPIKSSGNIVLEKVSTSIVSSAVSTVYNVDANLVFTLKDSKGNGLSNKNVNVVLNGVTYKKTTDKNGQVSVAVSGNLIPKTYATVIKFEGDSDYLASVKTVNVIVKKANPMMSASAKTFKKSVKTKKYIITLKTNQNKVMNGVKVTFEVKGKTYKATTNTKGQATFKIKNLKKKGTFKAKVKFAGNTYYNAVTKTVKIKIK